MLTKFLKPVLFFLLIIICSNSFSQVGLKLKDSDVATFRRPQQTYYLRDSIQLIYQKPKPFGFLISLPNDAKGILLTAFKRENIKPLLFTGALTLALMVADQKISNDIHNFSSSNHFHSEEDYHDVLNLKLGKTNISLFKAPKNINTALYQIGQGFPSLLIGAGLFTYGKLQNDYRALSTASQLTETFILMGVGTQVLKRMTGRQSPSNATEAGGDWDLFPAFKSFQNDTPNFDAFPSGHLATLMSTVTILAGNYPEKKFIQPVGYSIMGLVGLAMINNDVHWASDYPMAVGLGYLCARQVLKRNRKIIRSTNNKKEKTSLSYTFNYVRGSIMPGIRYKF